MSAFADYSAYERMAQMLSHNLDLVREAAGVDEETDFDELLEVLRSRRPAESTSPRLPPSLRSVDDVRRACEAAGLPEVTSKPALAAWEHNEKSRHRIPITRTWQDHDLRVKAVSETGRVRVTVEAFGGGDWSGEGRILSSAVFAAAIRAAREETP